MSAVAIELSRRQIGGSLHRIGHVLPTNKTGVGARHILITKLAETLGREGTARSPSAIENDLRFLVGQLALGLHLQKAAGQMNGAGDVPPTKLILLPNVHQKGSRLRLIVEPHLEVFEADDADRVSHVRKEIAVGLGHVSVFSNEGRSGELLSPFSDVTIIRVILAPHGKRQVGMIQRSPTSPDSAPQRADFAVLSPP